MVWVGNRLGFTIRISIVVTPPPPPFLSLLGHQMQGPWTTDYPVRVRWPSQVGPGDVRVCTNVKERESLRQTASERPGPHVYPIAELRLAHFISLGP